MPTKTLMLRSSKPYFRAVKWLLRTSCIRVYILNWCCSHASKLWISIVFLSPRRRFKTAEKKRFVYSQPIHFDDEFKDLETILNNNLMKALKTNKPDFVELYLDHGAQACNVSDVFPFVCLMSPAPSEKRSTSIKVGNSSWKRPRGTNSQCKRLAPTSCVSNRRLSMPLARSLDRRRKKSVVFPW